VLNAPRVVPAPPPLTDRFAPLIRIGLGLLAGVALAFLAHYLDPVLRGRDDLESLGLPVVASIPRK
jgi:capsular polysaccharide biosynthesis protein